MCHMTWLKTKLGALNEGVVQKASKIDIPEMDYHSFFIFAVKRIIHIYKPRVGEEIN